MSLTITSLPEDMILEYVSRLPRRYYPTLSLVSKFFQSLIASPKLYEARAVMDRTECFVYAIISLTNNIDGSGPSEPFCNKIDHLYTLRRTPDSNYSLVRITSIPSTPTSNNYVVVDSKIFLMGASSNYASLIDCRFHTARNLPNMPKDVANSVYGLVNGKIYVIGETDSYPYTPQKDMDLMVFDIKSETWESKMRQYTAVCNCKTLCKRVVTWDNKFYFHCFVYDPKEDKWEKDEILNSKQWYSFGGVMEGVLYYYRSIKRKLYAYDFKERCWKVVKGVDKLMSWDTVPRTVTYDKMVYLLFEVKTDEKREIWCAVIKVEKDQKGEFCGIVEWRGCVLDNGQWPQVATCSAVDV